MAVAKITGLGRTARRVVLGVEKKNDRLLPLELGERHVAPAVRGKRKIGGDVANFYGALGHGSSRLWMHRVTKWSRTLPQSPHPKSAHPKSAHPKSAHPKSAGAPASSAQAA